MAINDDIKAAIDKNLSMEVGKALKERLELVEILEGRLRASAKLAEERTQLIETQTAQLARAGDLVEKAKALQLKDAEVTAKLLRADLIALKEEHAKERVAEMRGLVLAVFANNQFKYQVNDNGYMPVSGTMGSSMQQASHSRTITATGEGAPPPGPGDVSR